MGSEQGRLEKLYGEMGDEHLLDMADEMDDLTDEARRALAHELRRRGLFPEPEGEEPVATLDARPLEPVVERELETGFGGGMPGIIPSGASMMEQALAPAEPVADPRGGMSRLISFYDGMELSKACSFLEDAAIEPVIEPIAGDALTGVPPRFEIWLETGEIERAQALLRAKMGLFPAAEVDDEGFSGDPATGLVGVFESEEEADEVRALLLQEGMVATSTHDEDEGMWHVTVAPDEQERAISLVAGELGL